MGQTTWTERDEAKQEDPLTEIGNRGFCIGNLAKHLQSSVKIDCFRQAIEKMSKLDEGQGPKRQIYATVPTKQSGLATALQPEGKALLGRILVPLRTKKLWAAGEHL